MSEPIDKRSPCAEYVRLDEVNRPRVMEQGAARTDLLLAVLWLAVVACSIAVVWTIPAEGDATAWRWLGTGDALFIGLGVILLAAD